MQARLNGYVDQQLQKVDATDCLLFEHVGIPMPDLEPIEDNSVTTRISHMVGRACGHELTVIGDIFLIIGLLAASTAMRWSMTGQLVSNIPPNLIEGFLMIVLISGDNIIDAKKLANLRRIHKRRLALPTAIESDAATVADTEKGSIRKNSVTITVSEKVELSNTIDLV
ncbi:low-affinity Fe(2+) transport protein [Ascosphaera atra]|nr:low-affinity Fe(2+) transport protein [Ascosphaera atra]